MFFQIYMTHKLVVLRKIPGCILHFAHGLFEPTMDIEESAVMRSAMLMRVSPQHKTRGPDPYSEEDGPRLARGRLYIVRTLPTVDVIREHACLVRGCGCCVRHAAASAQDQGPSCQGLSPLDSLVLYISVYNRVISLRYPTLG